MRQGCLCQTGQEALAWNQQISGLMMMTSSCVSEQCWSCPSRCQR
jgi:hypothetical protein